MNRSTPGLPVHHQLLGAYSNSCSLSQWCHPTISSSVIPVSSCLWSFPASVSFPVLHVKGPKYWSFSFSISPSNEYSGLISFRMNRLDLLAVQGTLKSLLQHLSSKASILWCSEILGLYPDFWTLFCVSIWQPKLYLLPIIDYLRS